MEYKITESEKSLMIKATAPITEHAKLMDEFSKCAAGTCSCPSRQFEKLSSINVKSNGDGIDIELIPRVGEDIDKNDIDNCLRFTAEKIAERHS